MISKKFIDELEYQVIGACIEVHKHLGPGLLENVYQQCLAQELTARNIAFEAECIVQVSYKGLDLDTRLRSDFFVEKCMVVELKAIEQLLPIHDAILLTYMKLHKAPKGLLFNFCCTHIIKHGKKSFVNDLYRALF